MYRSRDYIIIYALYIIRYNSKGRREKREGEKRKRGCVWNEFFVRDCIVGDLG